MGTSFRDHQPHQAYLFPQSPSDWLPEGHLAYFISDTVDNLDLSVFYAPYRGDGRRNRPFHPRMMLKVLIYCYAVGIFSSRKIARRIHEDVAVRFLAAGSFPRHRTIADFRKRHLEDFRVLFVQIVQIAREVGLAKMGTVAIDGSRIKANASKHKAMTYGRMKTEVERLRREISELTNKAEEIDAQEDETYGADSSGEDIPEELVRRETRLAKIIEAKGRLEAEQREKDESKGRHQDDQRRPPGGVGGSYKNDFGVPDDDKQINFTDPESRIMKTASKAYEQCYNAQITVAEEGQIIVAAEVTNCASDATMLLPMIDGARDACGRKPRQVLADSGYRSEANFVALQEKGIEAHVALACGESEADGPSAERLPASRAMWETLNTDAGKASYRRRKHIAEPPFAWIKQWMGFRTFSLRGLSGVRGEWNLVTLVSNIRRLFKLIDWVPAT